MSSPLFTVVVPAYNRADLLRLTLRSLKAQTFRDFEAWIIDDASTDHTPEVFREFANEPGWHFHRFEKNKRQAHCRNFAVSKASGGYITFLDADDLWRPDRLEKFAALIAAHPEAGFLFSNGYIMTGNSLTGEFFRRGETIPSGRLPAYMALSDKWLPYVTTNVAVPKAAFDKLGPFREDMSHLEDMEFYARLLGSYPSEHLAEPLSVYRIHALTSAPASLTLKWDDGIADFHTALKTAAPPAGPERELKDYVYGKQAVVFLKNGKGAKAREYLLKTSARGPAFTALYAAALLPGPAIAAARLAFRAWRSLKAKTVPPELHREIYAWMESLGSPRK